MDMIGLSRLSYVQIDGGSGKETVFDKKKAGISALRLFSFLVCELAYLYIS